MPLFARSIELNEKSAPRPLRPDYAVCITADWESDAPDPQGRGRSERLDHVLEKWPTALGGFIGGYPCRNRTLGSLYLNSFIESHPEKTDRVTVLADAYNSTPRNSRDAALHMDGQLLWKQRKDTEITLCTYYGHYRWLRPVFLALGYGRVSFAGEEAPLVTVSLQDEILYRITSRDPFWYGEWGRLCNAYVNHDARRSCSRAIRNP